MPSILDYFSKSSDFPTPVKKKIEKPKPTQQQLDEFRSLFTKQVPTKKKEQTTKKTFGSEPKITTDDPIRDDRLYVFTDGSCLLNGKPNARGGWAVYFPNGEFVNKAEKLLEKPTNQRCELTAIWVAILTAEEYLLANGIMELYTDSEYSINCMTKWCAGWEKKGWCKADGKPVENLDIIEPMYRIYSKHRHNINIHHIRAHTGRDDFYSKCNDVVDNMARNTISG